jgi:hypothetical protein
MCQHQQVRVLYCVHRTVTGNAVVWHVTPCGDCYSQLFGGTCRLHLQGRKITVLGTLAVTNKVLTFLAR